MAIDDETYNTHALQGHVGEVALKVSIAIDQIIELLTSDKGRNSPEFKEGIEELRRISDNLEDRFDYLSGWVDDDE